MSDPSEFLIYTNQSSTEGYFCCNPSFLISQPVKAPYFDRSGYCIWSKRLEQGQFHTHGGDEVKRALAWTDLKLILEGIDIRSVQQYKRYKHPANSYIKGE